MALRVSLCSSKFHRKPFNFQSNHSFSANPLNSRRKVQFSSIKNISDADLLADLATEKAKIKITLVQRKEAMIKSKELLFGEFVQYLNLKPEEVKHKWRNMDEIEKMNLVKGFVSEWSLSFHPLSIRSVKEMMEDHLKQVNPSVLTSPSLMFPSLKKILGMTQD